MSDSPLPNRWFMPPPDPRPWRGMRSRLPEPKRGNDEQQATNDPEDRSAEPCLGTYRQYSDATRFNLGTDRIFQIPPNSSDSSSGEIRGTMTMRIAEQETDTVTTIRT